MELGWRGWEAGLRGVAGRRIFGGMGAAARGGEEQPTLEHAWSSMLAIVTMRAGRPWWREARNHIWSPHFLERWLPIFPQRSDDCLQRVVFSLFPAWCGWVWVAARLFFPIGWLPIIWGSTWFCTPRVGKCAAPHMTPFVGGRAGAAHYLSRNLRPGQPRGENSSSKCLRRQLIRTR